MENNGFKAADATGGALGARLGVTTTEMMLMVTSAEQDDEEKKKNQWFGFYDI